MKLFMPFFFFILLNCNTHHVPNKTKYFKDIDLFIMKGINEIPSGKLKYPYIAVSYDSNSVEIVYVFDKDTKLIRRYEKILNNVWLSKHSALEGGEMHYFFEYVKKDEVVNIECIGESQNQNYSLEVIRRYKKLKTDSYFFKRGRFKFEQGMNIDELPIDSSFKNETSLIKIENDTLKYFEIEKGKIISSECYDTEGLSYFWWSAIGYQFKKINCSPATVSMYIESPSQLLSYPKNSLFLGRMCAC
jgi:hypothetical protein